MSQLPNRLSFLQEQTTARINAVGAMQNEHVFNYQKSLDYSYDIDRKLPSIAEVLGLRQFQLSESGGESEVDQVGNT